LPPQLGARAGIRGFRAVPPSAATLAAAANRLAPLETPVGWMHGQVAAARGGRRPNTEGRSRLRDRPLQIDSTA